MIKRKNGKVELTGNDEVTFSVILILLDLLLGEQSATRTDVYRAIYYFREMGLALEEQLFDRILARWDTRLAWGTSARHVAFPLDERDGTKKTTVAHQARRQTIWKNILEAVDKRLGESALRQLSNDIDVPNGNELLAMMADVCGPELLDRFSGSSEPALQQHAPSNPTKLVHPSIQKIFDELKADPQIEVGFTIRNPIVCEIL